MTPLGNDDIPPPGAVGDGGIVSGLYSIDIRMLDGIAGGHTGVMLLHDGRILGGDAFFYYLGAYSSANGRWKGEFVNQEHTPAKSEHPLFGGYEVGIGFSGRCDAKRRRNGGDRAGRQAQHPLRRHAEADPAVRQLPLRAQAAHDCGQAARQLSASERRRQPAERGVRLNHRAQRAPSGRHVRERPQ